MDKVRLGMVAFAVCTRTEPVPEACCMFEDGIPTEIARSATIPVASSVFHGSG